MCETTTSLPASRVCCGNFDAVSLGKLYSDYYYRYNSYNKRCIHTKSAAQPQGLMRGHGTYVCAY